MTPAGPAPIVDPAREGRAMALVAATPEVARRRGIVLTPPDLAIALAEATLPRQASGVLNVLDPTCGTGRLLAAAAQVAAARGIAVALHGIERESALAEVAHTSIPGAGIRVGDAIDLVDEEAPWDIILINPPYRGRLRRGDSIDDDRAAALKTRFGSLLGPYSDPATGFLLLSEASLRPGGRLGAIVPVSTVAARDAREARAHLARRCITRTIWSEPAPFAAQVHTASIVLERRSEPIEARCDWSSRLAADSGVPAVDDPACGVIGDVAEVTADFRDEYYALKGHVVECDDDLEAAPLLTCGLVDPATSLHGLRPARVHGRRWRAPGVRPHGDIDSIVEARRVPKVLVASQTAVLEAAIDHDGRYMPMTPLVRIVPRSASDVWRIGASLLAPQASALALHRHFGAGRAPGTLRLRASDIASLPLIDSSRSGDAMQLLQKFCAGKESFHAALACAARAFGAVPEGLLDWWWSRAPAHLQQDRPGAC